ncbi:hypothetical protein B5S33_g2275 [[Candida] boidinii]|nr:hypothetical protein B5S33_g2275 [[Candida] boidinii]
MTQLEPVSNSESKPLGSPKAILFTDWDGTVTLQDSNDYLTDHLGFGYEKRRAINDLMLDDKLSFRDGFHEMLESINVPFDKCIQYLLDNVQLDPGFKDTYHYCYENDIPVIVISSGMEQIIRALLISLVGENAINNIEIISNKAIVKDDGSWYIQYRDDTSFGHDKSLSIKACLNRLDKDANPILFYCGDGVSDLSAARETNLLYARRGKDLVTYCKRENIPFKQFDSFEDILASVKSIVSGESKLEDHMEKY